MKKQSYFKTATYKEHITGTEKSLLSAWPSPKSDFRISTRLGETFVQQCGRNSAPPLILLHGSGSNSSAWSGEVEKLCSKFQVFAADIPGDPGLSHEHRGSLENNDYTDWLTDVLEGLALRHASLAGVSLGGWIAAKWAAAFPGRTDKLILISASGFVQPKISFLFRIIAYSFLGNYGLKRMQKALFNSAVLDPEVEKWFRTMAAGYSPRREVPTLLDDAEIARLTMPVTYIGGDSDVLMNIQKSINRLEEILPCFRGITVPGQGHAMTSTAGYILETIET